MGTSEVVATPVFVDGLEEVHRVEAHHVVDEHGGRHEGVGEPVKDGVDVAHGHDPSMTLSVGRTPMLMSFR